MKASYTLSRPVLPVGTSSKIDLLVSFKAEASVAAAKRSLNLGLVIDRSGSMAGVPLQHALQASRQLVERMGPEDWLSIVTYDDSVSTVLAPVRVTDKAAIGAVLSKSSRGRLHQPQRRLAQGRGARERQQGERAHQPRAAADGRAGRWSCRETAPYPRLGRLTGIRGQGRLPGAQP